MITHSLTRLARFYHSLAPGTVLRMAKLRPGVPIIAGTYSIETARWLALVWGVYPVVLANPVGPFNFRDEVEKILKIAIEKGYCDPEVDTLTITAGLPFGFPGTTNTLRVVSAKGPDFWFDNSGKVKSYVNKDLK